MSDETPELENTEINPTTPEPASELNNNELISGFASEVAAYSEQTPDFADAFNYLIELRDKQLQEYSSLYPELQDINKRNDAIEAEAFEIIKISQQSGNNAVDFIYNLAKNLGYQHSEPQINLAQKQKAQHSAKTLTASNGGVAHSPMTLEGLAAMSQTEFDEWYWHNKREFKKIMGQ